MEGSIIYIVGGVLALLILLFIAKRVLRMAVKLIFVGIVVTALLVGMAYGWWNGWFSSESKSQRRPSTSRTAPQR